MMVEAQYRGRGIGRALLASAIAWARANGRPALTLRVFPDNERARTLYRTSGFTDVEVQPAAILRRDGDPRDAIVMRRPVGERDL
jgi:ribosomal protein S18 acetylase RimI-like enzyme